MRAGILSGAVAAAIAVVALAGWPGVPEYDTVAQYTQVLGGPVDDWHPPIMVRLWQALHPLANGTKPMFVLEMALYAFGFALLAGTLAASGRPRAGIATGILALSPLLIGWQIVVLKDAQLVGALVAAFAILAHYRLTRRPIPSVAFAAAALLIGYATLVRANGAFATVALVVLLLRRPQPIVARGAIALSAIVVILLLTPMLNARVFGALPSGVAKSQPLFDLAAIAVAAPEAPSPFTPAERAQIATRHCSKAFFWDPLGDPTACDPATARLKQLPDQTLYVDLARAAAEHPVAYAEHRLRHWNSTERWLVQPNLLGARPPSEAEPNEVGLHGPSNALFSLVQAAGGVQAATPIGWPIFWSALALLLAPIAWARRQEAEGELALALIASAITLEASFLVISIASDLRYHLWSMAASALALILLSNALRSGVRHRVAAGTIMLLVVGGGIATRMTLPPATSSYSAMVHGTSG